MDVAFDEQNLALQFDGQAAGDIEGDGGGAAAGTEAELAAVVDFARTRSDWSVSVSRCAAAWPGGPVDDALFDALVAEIVADVRREAPDAVVLSLHGAAITVRRQAPDLELVQRVRAALGSKPLLASFDLSGLDPAAAAAQLLRNSALPHS